MKTIATLLFFLLIYSFSHAQTAAKHTVFFDTDKHVISPAEQKKLDSFISKIGDGVIESIELSGHTDSDASSEYNLDLSKRRVEIVKEQLSGLNVTTKKVSAKFYGEDQPADVNTNASGKQNNRRVDIIAYVNFAPPIAPTRIIQEEETEVTGDTILRYPQGILVILPKEDVLKNPNCISLVEYTTGESVRAAHLTTMTSDGAPLISAGMFDIKMCDENKCVTVMVPARTVCGQTLPFTQWEAQTNGSWSEKNGRPLPVRMLNGINYYEMKVCRSGRINCDVRSGGGKKRRIPKTRIRLKNGYKITKIQIASNEPMVGVLPIRQTKRKAVFARFCPCTEALLYIEAKNKMGENKIIDFQPLNDYDKHEAFGKCKTDDVIKKILFFKIREKAMYRKYIIRKMDFEPKE